MYNIVYIYIAFLCICISMCGLKSLLLEISFIAEMRTSQGDERGAQNHFLQFRLFPKLVMVG